MSNENNDMQKELAELVSRHTDREGPQVTAISALSFSRYSSPHCHDGVVAPYIINQPSIYIVVQGIKDVIFGGEHFRYGLPNYLVSSMNLPIIAEVLEASNENPNLSLKIGFTNHQILELLNDDEIKRNSRKIKRGLNIAKLDESLLDAILRLVRLLDKPGDITILAPLFVKEILYKVLSSEYGDSLKQIVIDNSPTVSIQNAIQHIVNHYQEALRVEELAKIANMSVPSFFRHFKEITIMSPIQFQKQLRLQEARRLLITSTIDVAEAAYLVGYESTTQFIREYSRTFEFSPRKDLKRMKNMERE
ncbi:AraC family transcriptional regulator [Anoxybacterium hadale]|uniref:AraC family transcriptional regulator n=1 Tax=Anoxybacterium hadale TaxID=3408580 RepID=A0ACD1A8K0_9FIRM|nr:AraC family transcriptional regulator [Clostridiales bacterium]